MVRHDDLLLAQQAIWCNNLQKLKTKEKANKQPVPQKQICNSSDFNAEFCLLAHTYITPNMLNSFMPSY